MVTLILIGNGFVISNGIKGAEGRNEGKHGKYKGFETKDGGKMQSGGKEPGKLLRSIELNIFNDLE